MKTLYLHIGLPKTGTSAIQRFLNDNSEVLERRGYAYPIMPVEYKNHASQRRNAHFLVEQEYDENGKPDMEATLKKRQLCMGVVKECFKNADNVILTDESLWNQLGGDGIEILEYMADFCSENDVLLKLVVYLREQSEYMLSLWRQKVRAGRVLPPWSEFARKSHSNFNFHKQLKRLMQYVEKENMIVKIYDRESFSGGNIFSDFLGAVGLEFTDEYIIEKELVNLSLSDNQTEIKRILNTLQGENAGVNSEVSRLLEKPLIVLSQNPEMNRNPYSLLTKGDTEYISEKYRESNERVRQEFFPDREALFDLNKKNAKPEWSKDNPDMIDDIILYFGQLAVEQQKQIDRLNEEVDRLKNQNKIMAAARKLKHKILK